MLASHVPHPKLVTHPVAQPCRKHEFPGGAESGCLHRCLGSHRRPYSVLMFVIRQWLGYLASRAIHSYIPGPDIASMLQTLSYSTAVPRVYLLSS